MRLTPLYYAALSATRYVSFERVTRNRIHRHSFFEPCIVVSGEGEFEHGSKVFALREGDLFIANPGIYHEIRSLRTKDLPLLSCLQRDPHIQSQPARREARFPHPADTAGLCPRSQRALAGAVASDLPVRTRHETVAVRCQPEAEPLL